jgi:hypothetical protein
MIELPDVGESLQRILTDTYRNMVFLASRYYEPYAEIKDFVGTRTLVSVRPHSAWLVIMPSTTEGSYYHSVRS